MIDHSRTSFSGINRTNTLTKGLKSCLLPVACGLFICPLSSTTPRTIVVPFALSLKQSPFSSPLNTIGRYLPAAAYSGPRFQRSASFLVTFSHKLCEPGSPRVPSRWKIPHPQSAADVIQFLTFVLPACHGFRFIFLPRTCPLLPSFPNLFHQQPTVHRRLHRRSSSTSALQVTEILPHIRFVIVLQS
ncbi:hypothetical protein VTI74DRAFT_7861 [Chaetomium olivicolor]